MRKKRFVAYFYCNGFDFNLGIHVSWSQPNIEIHVPCGFFRIGWSDAGRVPKWAIEKEHTLLYRTWGWE